LASWRKGQEKEGPSLDNKREQIFGSRERETGREGQPCESGGSEQYRVEKHEVTIEQKERLDGKSSEEGGRSDGRGGRTHKKGIGTRSNRGSSVSRAAVKTSSKKNQCQEERALLLKVADTMRGRVDMLPCEMRFAKGGRRKVKKNQI